MLTKTEDPDICYLNHAKDAVLSPRVQKEGVEAIVKPVWEQQPDEAVIKHSIRALFASLIKVLPEEICIVPSTAFAISLAARNILHCTEGKEAKKIVLLQDQMCSAVYPWQWLVRNSGGKFILDVVQPCEKDLTNEIVQQLNDDVAVVCLPPLHWSSGQLIDLDVITETCKKYQIDLVIDGTQAIGILPCHKIIADKDATLMVTCSSQKWLRGPPGISLCYVNPKIYQSWQPLDQHGRSRNLPTNWNAHPGTMDAHNGYPEEFIHDARKLDSGGHFNYSHLIMLRASLEEVCQLDLEQCQEKLKCLLQPLLEWAVKRKGMWIPSAHAGHLIGLRPASTLDVDKMLLVCHNLEFKEKIFISVRNGFFRVSPYLTNKPQDIMRLIDGFEKYL
mmetsp:Transcript_6495/g.9559  ORF Transcript_6495/g.9559 Transcript_6495/m.9559 type:complete len:390 (+) Transcript_6495:281-1450(+)